MPWEVASSKMRFTKIITLNQAMKKKMTDILHIRKEKIEIIPSGIDLKEICKIKAKKKEKTIVYVGRLVPQKNIDALIKAFSMLGRKDAQLRIVGDGSERSELEKLAKRLDIKNITFTGRLKEYSDMIKEIKQATLLVLPSQRENFGIVPIEAMACGTPVISSNTEGPRDYIKSGMNGFLTSIGSAEEIKEKMEILLDNKALRDRIIKNGMKTAKDYDWNNIVKRIADVYIKLK
jgi:glycosyltransferase involved in cell wall biosynthesis